MCKGMAVLANDKEVLVGKDCRHDAIAQNVDGYAKINVIYDDREKEGYRIELDVDGSRDSLNHYKEKGWVNKDGSLKADLSRKVKEKLEANRGDVFKVLCKNMQTAYVEGDQDQWSQTVKGDQDQGNQTVEGNQDQRNQTVKGDQDQRNQTVEGDQNQGNQTVEGNQDQRNQTVKGMILIYGMKNGGKELQTLLDEFTKEKENKKDYMKATLENFIAWIQDKTRTSKEGMNDER
jgi:hypothetical protein